MKKLLFILILSYSNFLICQQDNERSNTMLNPEQEAILQTKQLSLRLDLNKIQEEKIISFLKSHLIEGRKIRQKRKKEMSNEESFNLRVQFLDHQKSLQEKFKLLLDSNQYKEWRVLQKLREDNLEKRKARNKKK